MPEQRVAEPLLSVRQMKKHYPGVRALKGVDLDLRAGSVTALVGENGAGKSTIIRILAGIERPSGGTMTLHGRPLELSGPAQSQAAGISVVSQEFRLVPQLAVYENVFLGQEQRLGPFVNRAVAIERTRALLNEFGLDIDPRQRVGSLAIGDQQLVEIARALAREFEVIIFDEPTAALNRAEVDKLLRVIDDLRSRGKAILYVSHHMDEIMEISDRIAVFRDGRSVADVATSDAVESEIVAHMLGRELAEFERNVTHHPDAADAKIRLRVRGLRTARLRQPIDLDVHAGEVVGFAGLIGSGRSEILAALFGEQFADGRIEVDGRRPKRGPRGAIAASMFFLSEDRKAAGIFPHLSVRENLFTGRTGRPKRGIGRFLPIKRDEVARFDDVREKLRIRVDRPQQLIGNLSGGNQQKVLFGRAVGAECAVLLLNEPTRGVDVGAKGEIYQIIAELAERGIAVLVSSSDAPELVTLSDRCYVLQKGRIVKQLTGGQITEDAIVSASIGTSEERE